MTPRVHKHSDPDGLTPTSSLARPSGPSRFTRWAREMPAFENRRRSPSRTRASARDVRRSKAETTSIFVAASERPGSSHILRHWTVCRLSVTLSSPPMKESRHVVSNVASRSTVWYAHDSESVVPIACTFLRSLTTGEMDEVTRMGSPPGSARPTFSTSSPALAAGADPGSATRPRSATDATSAAVAIPPVPKPRDGCARPRHVATAATGDGRRATPRATNTRRIEPKVVFRGRPPAARARATRRRWTSRAALVAPRPTRWRWC